MISKYLNYVLGVLLVGALLLSAFEYADAAHWKAKDATDIATVDAKSAQAAADAVKLTEDREQGIRDQGFRAATAAQASQKQAEANAEAEHQKLIALAQKYKDLGHQCAVTVEPKDDLPR